MSEIEQDVDVVTTEIIRHGLISAAEQMKRTIVRTSFSTLIYDVLDFAVAIYDREFRLLAQAPTLLLFMGSLDSAVRNAVEAVGGEASLQPDDVLLYNTPYGTGSHAPDVTISMPIFLSDGTLIAYAATKAHWLDVAGKDPYSSDTVDVFQEGTIFPGVKLYRAGVLVDDVYRTLLANTRAPDNTAGDMQAQVNGCQVAATHVTEIVERYGTATFEAALELIFDHGEAAMRACFERLPDGRHVGRGELDDDGVEPGSIPFEVVVAVSGSQVTVDLMGAPAQRGGPVNCPLPSTVCAVRLTLAMLAGAGGSVNEGHFRCADVRTTAGTLFHPITPAPTYLYAWVAQQLMEVVLDAIGRSDPDLVPAWSGADICGIIVWGAGEIGHDSWIAGSPHPVGQGAHRGGDGANALMCHCESATHFSSVEVGEARHPWIVDRLELAPDSGGAGARRGGLGIDIHYRLRKDAFATLSVERTAVPPAGLSGGLPGRPNSIAMVIDGVEHEVSGKATRMAVPVGATLVLRTGGGGGHGRPEDRSPERVADDLADGVVTADYVRLHHPSAVEECR